MATELRDLEADRRLALWMASRIFRTDKNLEECAVAFNAALDEIDRLKRLLVLYSGDKFLIHDGHSFIGEVKQYDTDRN